MCSPAHGWTIGWLTRTGKSERRLSWRAGLCTGQEKHVCWDPLLPAFWNPDEHWCRVTER